MAKYIALFLLVVGSAHAELLPVFKWAHTYDVPSNVTIAVTTVSDYRLKQLIAQYGSRDGARAISILHKRGDVWSCEVFISQKTDRAAALDHEVKHCHGWSHD